MYTGDVINHTLFYVLCRYETWHGVAWRGVAPVQIEIQLATYMYLIAHNINA